MDVDCAVASETASCVETDAGTEANDPGTSTVMLSDISHSLAPVTITAGLDLLSGASSGDTTTTGAETSSTGASTGAAVTGTAATKTSTHDSTLSKTSSAADSAAATGAATRADRNVVLAGVVGVVGMAMAL